MEHVYKLAFDLKTKHGKFKAGDIKKAWRGGTDGLVVISCIEAEDGSYSQTHSSYDGNAAGKSMSTTKEYKAWLLMGAALLRRQDLSEVQKYILSANMELVRESMGV